MSDKPISKGDLVMVVRPTPCCGRTGKRMGLVARVVATNGDFNCSHCDASMKGQEIALEGHLYFPRQRLIRLDPDALKDDVPASEELTV